MPKETLHYPSFEEPEGADQPPMVGPEVTLHWSNGPESVIQFGFEFEVDVMLEHLRLLKQGSRGDTRTMWYTGPVTRAETNRSIKALRRARDATYGSDE